MKVWKKGKGTLGVLKPLVEHWEAHVETQMGKVHCTRTFEPVLQNQFIQLTAVWNFPKGSYMEHALFGAKDGVLCFWSFTSDGKQSNGQVCDASDIHPEAIGFEAEMPAGLARMIYWPGEEGTMCWAVESKTKKGWNRFMEHQYHPVHK
mgnify:CR=1 FL=1